MELEGLDSRRLCLPVGFRAIHPQGVNHSFSQIFLYFTFDAFPNASNFTSNFFSHHFGTEMKYKAGLATSYSTIKMNNDGLVDTMEEKTELEYNCVECDFRANKKCYLVKHVQSQHVKYSCNRCKYEGNKEELFLLHIKSMHGKIWYDCEKCNYGTRSKASLKIHMQSKHEGIYFMCTVCPYQASTKASIAKHTKTIHEGVRYPCKYCEFMASSIYSLRKHDFSKHLDKRSKL